MELTTQDYIKMIKKAPSVKTIVMGTNDCYYLRVTKAAVIELLTEAQPADLSVWLMNDGTAVLDRHSL